MLPPIALVLTLIIAAATSTPIVEPILNSRCSNECVGKFIKLQISDCQQAPCAFIAGSSINVSLTYVPDTTTSHMRYVLNFHECDLTCSGANTFVSKYITGTFQAGTEYTISQRIFIPTNFPAAKSGYLHVHIFDEDTLVRQICRLVDTTIYPDVKAID